MALACGNQCISENNSMRTGEPSCMWLHVLRGVTKDLPLSMKESHSFTKLNILSIRSVSNVHYGYNVIAIIGFHLVQSQMWTSRFIFHKKRRWQEKHNIFPFLNAVIVRVSLVTTQQHPKAKNQLFIFIETLSITTRASIWFSPIPWAILARKSRNTENHVFVIINAVTAVAIAVSTRAHEIHFFLARSIISEEMVNWEKKIYFYSQSGAPIASSNWKRSHFFGKMSSEAMKLELYFSPFYMAHLNRNENRNLFCSVLHDLRFTAVVVKIKFKCHCFL